MMPVRRFRWLLPAVLVGVFFGGSCLPANTNFLVLPIDTNVAFFNFSTQYYATLGVREHRSGSTQDSYTFIPLLAPGAADRVSFTDLTGSACPGSVDLQLRLYKRVNDSVPIGLDPGEAVEPAPIVAGEVQGVPACSVQQLETYTVTNWDAAAGVGRVKIAQCSAVDDAIMASGLFGNAEGVWEINGVDPALATSSPPAAPPMSPIVGRVVLANGQGIEGIGVLVRSRYRTRLDCANPDNPDDAGYSLPIAFTVTDTSGRFELDRPAGVYELEFFSDTYAFRPGIMQIETPLDEISVLAEPL